MADGEKQDIDKIIEIILILTIPPLAVLYHDKAVTNHLWINICLCLLFVFPGVFHAAWYCFARKQ